MRELERATAPDTSLTPALTLVGLGRAGGALAASADRAGIAVRTVGRGEVASACSGAGLVLLCVPDGAIGEVVDELLRCERPPRMAGHVSGASGLDLLAPLAEKGVATFSLHPLQTIPDGAADLTGAPCAIAAADPRTLEAAADLAIRLGMRPFAVPEPARAAYHAAASMASNFLVTLEEAAASLLAAAGIADGRELLAPLVLRTAENWAHGGRGALTGPIARGDEQTVERQRTAMAEAAPALLPLFDAMAERTRALVAA